MIRYAVVDVETTGLSLARRHRIVEIAVVLADDAGSVVSEWSTIINPERDVGATHIHGLSGADVYRAPTFEQIAGELRRLLAHRVVVAHNLAFDAAFVAAEFERVGFTVPLTKTSGLCTMRMAPYYLHTGPRSLESCCNSIGWKIASAHAALDDTRAAAALLAHYIETDIDFMAAWGDVIADAQNQQWPIVPPSNTPPVLRQQGPSPTADHFLGRLALRTPQTELHPNANNYFALLDRVLLDRMISRHEEDELVAAAKMIGIGREDATRLHQLYLSALGQLALEDGIVTPDERSDLDTVAVALGLNKSDVDTALSKENEYPITSTGVSMFALEAGDTVVFTGEALGIERADLKYQAKSLGLRVTSAVSGRTSLLITADPDSISGKARKAREVGTPIVDYPTYFNMLDSIQR